MAAGGEEARCEGVSLLETQDFQYFFGGGIREIFFVAPVNSTRPCSSTSAQIWRSFARFRS